MKIRLAPKAEADLSATLEFIRERNPAAAIKLANKVFGSLDHGQTDRSYEDSARLLSIDGRP